MLKCSFLVWIAVITVLHSKWNERLVCNFVNEFLASNTSIWQNNNFLDLGVYKIHRISNQIIIRLQLKIPHRELTVYQYNSIFSVENRNSTTYEKKWTHNWTLKNNKVVSKCLLILLKQIQKHKRKHTLKASKQNYKAVEEKSTMHKHSKLKGMHCKYLNAILPQ